jgi:flagellar motor component MotA
MSNNSDDVVLKRILAHFENIAPRIVKDSALSLEADQPLIDHYDSDFYLEKMEGAFDDVEESKLRKIVFENIDQINAVFYKYYKTAKAGKS